MNIQEILQIMDKASQIGITTFEFNGLKLSFNNASNKIPVVQSVPFVTPWTNGNMNFGLGNGPEINPQDLNLNSGATQMPNNITSSGSVPDKKVEEIFKQMSALDELSPDEVLYAATPYFDELQAKKEAHQEKIDKESKQGN